MNKLSILLLIVGSLILGGILLFGLGESDTSDNCDKGNPVLSSTICPRDTCECENDRSRDYTIPYSSELNLNSTCDDIKDYILTNLERINSDVFHSSDDTPITVSMKKELIFVLENSSSLIEEENGNLTPGIRFKFCCPTEQNCLL